MKKLFILLSVSFLMIGMFSLSGCKKQNDNPIPNYELRFTNTSSNPYSVEVNGETDILSGNTFKNYTLRKGTYAWKVTQQSGYVLYPTIEQGTMTLDQNREIVFP